MSCPSGKYCPDLGMTAAGPDCDAGYYWSSKAYTPDPDDGLTGWKWQVGYYWEAGTSAMQKWNAGF